MVLTVLAVEARADRILRDEEHQYAHEDRGHRIRQVSTIDFVHERQGNEIHYRIIIREFSKNLYIPN